jgi:hypothetical protein
MDLNDGMKHTDLTRREWLKVMATAAILAPALPTIAAHRKGARIFHVCLSPTALEKDPGLAQRVRDAGVSTVWLPAFFYGHRPYSNDQIVRARKRLEDTGLEPQLLNCALGHPGDALGDASLGDQLSRPPRHWHNGQRPDGTLFTGTSLHVPATEENSAALREQRKFGFRTCFLDDDFRLARSPGEIGGCFCEEHRREFLQTGGYDARRWDELVDDAGARRLTPLLRQWLEFNGKQLTASFRAQRRAFGGDLGIMVMYLGAEKAGIRLKDYRGVPFRVGELMFNDPSFASVKNKTDELFSVLFHRRFVLPEHAFSETTAYPHDQLSGANLAAKLVISTLADVRNTMFMSGLTPFPGERWSVLAPAMREQARLHEAIAGHRPRGPFKHYWGEAQRLVGDDAPFSLWLAAGVPFEVVDKLPADGWTFLSDFDAREQAAPADETKSAWICRDSAAKHPAKAGVLNESLPALFAFKKQILPRLQNVPHVEEDQPAVCAWYPTARKVMVWNLSEQAQTLTLIDGTRRTELKLGPLGAGLAEVAARKTSSVL